jgi:hypothetical protein
MSTGYEDTIKEAPSAGESRGLELTSPMALALTESRLVEVVIVTVGGAEIKLEAGAGANAKGLAEEFARARAII